MPKYHIKVAPFAMDFLRSTVRATASDPMLFVLQHRYKDELGYEVIEIPMLLDGLQQHIDLAGLRAGGTKNLREKGEYEAAKRGLVVAYKEIERLEKRRKANA